jgi:hypothetical protein
MRWAGNVAHMAKFRNTYKILVKNAEGKRPFGRPRRRWQDDIRMDRREIGWEGVEWMHLAEDYDQWRAVLNFRFYMKGGEFLY